MRHTPFAHLAVLNLFLLAGCLPSGGGGGGTSVDGGGADACAPTACACEDGRAGTRGCEVDACVCGDGDAFVGGFDGGGTDGGASDGGAPDGQPPPGDAAPVTECDEGARQRRPCGANANGLEARDCVDGAWTPWGACEDPDACTEGETDREACGVGDGGARERTCLDGQWSAFGPCDDPGRPCEDGAVEQVPCGLNRRGFQSHSCDGERWGPFDACEDPDLCIDGAQQAEGCGLNGRGQRVRACVEGQWAEFDACEDVDACVDEARESRPCGLNDRGAARRSCVEGNWAAWGACEDPDVCVDGDAQVDPMACGVEGNGTRSRACAEGAWGEWGACDDPDRVCGAGETETVPCGLNGRGERSHACEGGRWGAFGPCADPDACIDDNQQQRACGLNGNGEQSRSCVRGQWRAWSNCADPDVCVEDDEESRACGRNRRGTSVRRCDGGQWSHWGDCADPDVCVDGSVAHRACEGDREQTRTCNRGAWSPWSACETPGCDPTDARCLRCTDALEPNSSDREAAAIVHGETVVDDLTLCTDRDRADWYGITVDAPSVVRAEVHWEGNVEVGFVGGYTATSGSAGGFGWGNPQAMGTSFVAPADVATYVRASVPADPANTTIDYRLEVTTEPFPVCVPGGSANCVPCTDAVPNDTRAQAIEIDLGEPVEDAVCGAWFEETTDAWKVQVPGPGTLVITLEQQRWFAGGAVLWVRDAEGTLLDDERDGNERRIDVAAAQPVVALVESDRGASQYRLRFDFESHICGDGQDNDGDGLIDEADPGCANRSDDDEADPAVPAECADGIDNDEDGATDYPNDPDCDYAGGPHEEPICELEAALPVVLEPANVVELPIFTGVAGADYGARCGASGRGQERPLRLVAPVPMHLVALITDADYDTVLHARRVCDDPRSELDCNDDGGEGNLSRLELDLDAGSTFLFVDAFAQDGGGDATLRLTTTPR